MTQHPAPLTTTQTSRQSKSAEFGRWLIVAIGLSILAPAAGTLFDRIGGESTLFPGMIAFWIAIGTGEAWVQFTSKSHRFAWVTSAAITGAILDHLLNRSTWDSPHVFTLFIPATMELLIARRERVRAWIWLIATPLVYGSADLLISLSGKWVSKALDAICSAIGVFSPIPSFYPEITTVFAVILLLRAIAGSFIASRKPEPI